MLLRLLLVWSLGLVALSCWVAWVRAATAGPVPGGWRLATPIWGVFALVSLHVLPPVRRPAAQAWTAMRRSPRAGPPRPYAGSRSRRWRPARWTRANWRGVDELLDLAAQSP
jgi:hypothetical protein